MKSVVLKPIHLNPRDFDKLEIILLKVFAEMFRPIFEEFKETKKNSLEDLVDAIRSGKLVFYRGEFKGKLNSRITKELKAIGAKWDRYSQSFKLPLKDLPQDIKIAIAYSEDSFKRKMARVDLALSNITPFIPQKKMIDFFDTAIFRLDKDIQKSLKAITVSPKLTDEQRKQIATEYTTNLERYVKDFTDQQVLKLREMMAENYQQGIRYEGMVKTIQKTFKVSENKAKFLARQETSLMMAEFKKTRYQDAGVQKYIWTCVSNPKDKSPDHHTLGNVRYYHGILDGKVINYNSPPITDGKGHRNHAGQDYNCFTGSTILSLNGRVKKMFRRIYNGNLTKLITSDGILEATPNHPVLTQRGWISAHQVNIGDYIIKSIGQDVTMKMDGENIKPSFEQVFDAISLCSQIFSDTLSSSDFHDDVGLNKNIDVISVDRELMLNRISLLLEQLIEFNLKRPDDSIFELSSCFQDGLFNFSTSNGLVSFANDLALLLKAHVSKTNEICLRAISRYDSFFQNPFSNSSSGNIVFLANGKFAHPISVILNSVFINFDNVVRLSSEFNADAIVSEILAQSVGVNSDDTANFFQSHIAGLVKFERVIEKSVSNFSGHIYNLENVNNWYLADNFIVHNCRCYQRPVLEFKE